MPDKPVGQLKPVNPTYKPVGKLKPVNDGLTPIGRLKEGDPNTILPKYTTPQDLAVDSSIDFIKNQGKRGGLPITDSEAEVLKKVLGNPNATKEQREKAILAIRGYDEKQSDNNLLYYNKLEDNGVYVPTALGVGERPPKGYDVASVFSNQDEANYDTWYQDLGKSLYNGVIGASQGVVDVAQMGQTLVTGEQSQYLNHLKNIGESLKFRKDEDLSKQIYNTEGINSWADVLDKNRFDINPQTLWGSLNMAAESLTEMGVIAAATGGAGLGTKAAVFTGSFASQVGDVIDSGKEAGLSDREASLFGLAVGSAMAGIDATFGIDGKILSNAFKKSKNEIIKEAVKSIPKNAAGEITEQGFKELAKITTAGYTNLAKNGIKEVIKDAVEEGGQEVAQDFVQKAGENLWDKLTPEDKAKFGTDAFDAKSFGSYLNSFAQGLSGGAPMSLVNTTLKNKNIEQSETVYDRVKQGPLAIQALKNDLDQNLKAGKINQKEFDNANFKIDKYQQYHELTSKYDLDPSDEKRAFELSFQIEGLKTEIPKDENLISKMGPLERGEVEADQSQVKSLQKEVNEIILRAKIKKEPVVGEKIENDVVKKKEEVVKKEYEKASPKVSDEEKEFNKTERNIKFEEQPKLPKQPAWKTDTRQYEDVDTKTFNNLTFDARTKHRMLRKYLSKQPNKTVFGNLTKRGYSYLDKDGLQHSGNVLEATMEDGRKIQMASSKDEQGQDLYRRHFMSERTQGNEEGLPVGIKEVDLNDVPENYPFKGKRIPTDYSSKKKLIKIYDLRTGKFLSWAKETKLGLKEAKDKNGNPLYSPEELEVAEHLKTIVEPTEGNEVIIDRLIKPKAPVIKPTEKEREAAAMDKLVAEAKSNKEKRDKEKLSKEKQVKEAKKENGKEKSTVIREKSESRDNEKVTGEGEQGGKEIKLRSSKNRSQRKVKHPARIAAGKLEVFTPQELAMQYFVNNGFISKEAIDKLYKGSNKEWFVRQNLTQEGAPNLKELAHRLWEESDKRYSDQDFVNALESVLQDYSSPIKMAEDLLKSHGQEQAKLNRLEELTLGASSEAANEGYLQEHDEVIDALETQSDEKLKAISESDNWENEITDIVTGKIDRSKETKQMSYIIGFTKGGMPIYGTAEEQDFVRKKGPVLQAEYNNNENLRKILDFENEPFQKVKETEFNDEYLKEVSKQSKDIINGKEVYKRFSQEEQSGLIEGGKANVEASIIVGRSIGTNENQDERNERQEEEIQKYAEKVGIWHENTEDFIADKGIELEGGQESIVHYDEKDGKVYKTSITNQYRDLQDFLDGITIHNTYFPASKIEVIGFGRDSDGEFNVITSQDFIQGTHDISQEKIDNYMQSIGFKKGDSVGRFKNDDVLINDVTPKNVILTKEGNIIPFDTIPHLNSKVQPMNEKGTRIGIHADHLKQLNKVIDSIKKSLPKVEVVIDDSLEGIAGKIGKDGKIHINPNYAGLDTPIHEAGHILIDAIGYENKVIQKAIEQLKGTELYKETKQRYPELSEKELNKEVLAESIGREGAGIFDKEADKSKFRQYLEYIFDWLKRKLGLDKNVTKSLAKQVLSGIGTKELTAKKGKEQLQKEKKRAGLRPVSFEQYLAEKSISAEKEQAKIDEAEGRYLTALEQEAIASESENDEEYEAAKKELKLAKQERQKARKNLSDYLKYKKEFKVVQELLKEKDLTDYSIEELQDVYSKVQGFDDKSVKAFREQVMLRIADELHRQGRERIKKDHTDYMEDVAKKKDIGKGQVWLLSGSHFSEYQPEVQEMYKVVQNAQLNKIKESNEKKNTNEQLARKVIAEENKKRGITAKHLVDKFSSDSATYFEWMDNGKGGLITMDEAKAKGYSKARLDYLDFTRSMLAERDNLMKENGYENADASVIKIDKKFGESFKQDGLAQAFSYYLGGGTYNLGNVRIMYKGKPTEFKNIEKDIIEKSNNGTVVDKIKALFELLYYNFSARKQLKRGFNVDEKENPLEIKGNSEYSLNNRGQLVSKFDKPRTQDRGYSKDFYRAMIEFIDDTSHVKHMNPVLPLIDSVELLNEKGWLDENYAIKPNVAKWLNEFKGIHVYKEKFINDPTLDAALKFFRKLTAMSTMWFNWGAGIINLGMGNYSSWRQENFETVVKGNKRLFSKTKGIDPYSLAILKKYNVVNQDYDSNPKFGFGKVFDKAATFMTKIGEFQIQGSLALGLMSDEVYNSFEFEKDKYGNDQLVLKKGADEAKVNEEMTRVKNRVSDIQGKYSDEDRRNIMRGEIAKAVFQFKVWLPDYLKERFGARYINANNEVREGTFRQFIREGFKQTLTDLKSGNVKELLKNKSLMANLKGLAAITSVLIWKYQDDDDDENRRKATLADNALGQLLVLLDPEQLKYTLANPAAALGKMKDFVSAVEALVTADEKAWEKTKRVLPANKLLKTAELIME